MVNERWCFIQPIYHNGEEAQSNMGWLNNSFLNTSIVFKAPMYHIDDIIPLDFDVYWLLHFDLGVIEKELAFLRKVKEKGKKVFVTFSHDMRFLHGHGLLSDSGILWTEFCEVADAVGGGVSDDLKVFGRYQNKVVPFGDILLDLKMGKPYEERTIDVLSSGPGGEQFLSYELETLLLIKERHPEKRIVCLIHVHHRDLMLKVKSRFPQIEFPSENVQPLVNYMADAKFYYNPELRPRPGRALMEAYYCRTPFTSCEFTYFSRLCPDFTYNKMSLVDIADTYDKFLTCDYNTIVKTMEKAAEDEAYEKIYERIINKINEKK